MAPSNVRAGTDPPPSQDMLPVFSTRPPLIQARRVLVVDDDRDRRTLLAKMMRDEGYEVDELGDGDRLLDHCAIVPPDLILLDIELPSANGIELCGDLRMNEATRTTPIIMITAEHLDEASAVRCLMAGADDYMCTPLRLKELKARVHVQLRNRRDREMLRWTQQQHATLRTAVRLDALTGVANRRAGDEAIARALGSGEAVMLLLADVDHFKAVNDNFGHAVGDHVLKAVASRMQERTRRGDVLARFGGEEFLVVIQGADESMAEMIGERFRKAVEEITFDDPDSGGVERITISVGMGSWSGRGLAPSAQRLLEVADRALYAAKNSGRNRVCTYSVASPNASDAPKEAS